MTQTVVNREKIVIYHKCGSVSSAYTSGRHQNSSRSVISQDLLQHSTSGSKSALQLPKSWCTLAQGEVVRVSVRGGIKKISRPGEKNRTAGCQFTASLAALSVLGFQVQKSRGCALCFMTSAGMQQRRWPNKGKGNP